MMGKMGLTTALLFFGVLLVILAAVPYSGRSAEYQTGTTRMNVTIRGYVSIGVSGCLTNGITFSTQDPSTAGINATCNTGGPGGTGFNLTVDPSSTVSINFSHAGNRTNLTDGTNTFNIGNVTYNSDSTSNTGAILSNSTATSLSNGWGGMETCGTLGNGANCWATYFLDIPGSQPPGVYMTGYCWCGRQQATDEVNCGTCT